MAKSPLQQAWAEGSLPANIREILETKQGSHHNYARVAVQTPHTSAGKVSRHLSVKSDANSQEPSIALLCVGEQPVTTIATSRANSSHEPCFLTSICQPASSHMHSYLFQVSRGD